MKIEVAIIELRKKYATLDRAFVASRENQKLGREIKKKLGFQKIHPSVLKARKRICVITQHIQPQSVTVENQKLPEYKRKIWNVNALHGPKKT